MLQVEEQKVDAMTFIANNLYGVFLMKKARELLCTLRKAEKLRLYRLKNPIIESKVNLTIQANFLEDDILKESYI